MEIIKSKKTFPSQTFNGKTYYQYEGRYFTRHDKKMHRDVWEFYNGEIPKGHHIHHIDGDVTNNDISNLQLMEAKEHLKMEGKKRAITNPQWFVDFQAKGILKAKEWHKSEEGREWHSKNGIISFVKRQPKIMNCSLCGKQYETTKYANAKFCSNNCKSAHRRLTGIDNVKRNCVVCGVEFECNKYTHQRKCKRGCKNH